MNLLKTILLVVIIYLSSTTLAISFEYTSEDIANAYVLANASVLEKGLFARPIEPICEAFGTITKRHKLGSDFHRNFCIGVQQGFSLAECNITAREKDLEIHICEGVKHCCMNTPCNELSNIDARKVCEGMKKGQKTVQASTDNVPKAVYLPCPSLFISPVSFEQLLPEVVDGGRRKKAKETSTQKTYHGDNRPVSNDR